LIPLIYFNDKGSTIISQHNPMQHECMGKKPLPGEFPCNDSDSKISYDQPESRILNVSLKLGITLGIDVGTNKRGVGEEK
jgi:hypothetical protein